VAHNTNVYTDWCTKHILSAIRHVFVQVMSMCYQSDELRFTDKDSMTVYYICSQTNGIFEPKVNCQALNYGQKPTVSYVTTQFLYLILLLRPINELLIKYSLLN